MGVTIGLYTFRTAGAKEGSLTPFLYTFRTAGAYILGVPRFYKHIRPAGATHIKIQTVFLQIDCYRLHLRFIQPTNPLAFVSGSA